jgi:hypothetical protein
MSLTNVLKRSVVVVKLETETVRPMRGKIALEERFAIEETVRVSAGWPFDAATISENDRLKIGRDNARALFRPAGA